MDTTVGRMIIWDVIPEGMSFDHINKVLKSKDIGGLLNECYNKLGTKDTVIFADQMMYLGFKYSTFCGVSVGVDDLIIPEEKATIVSEAQDEVEQVSQQYESGLLTPGERYNKVIDIWSSTTEQVAKAMMTKLSEEIVTDKEGKQIAQPSFNSVFVMADSGARGSAAQMRQLAGMRG